MKISLRVLLAYLSNTAVSLWFFAGISETQRRFRISRFFVLLAALAALLYLYISPYLFQFWIRFIYRSVIYFFLLKYVYELNGQRALFFAVLTTIMLTTCQNIFDAPVLHQLTQIFFPESMGIAGEFLNTGVRTLFQLLVFFLAKKILPISHIQSPSRSEWMVTLLTILCELYVKQTLYTINKRGEQTDYALTTFTLLLQVIQLGFFLYFERYMDNQNSLQELIIQDLTNQHRIQSLEQKNQNDEIIRSLHHDMKNHLHTISHLATAARNDKINEYINGLLQETAQFELAVTTGNSILDGLLTEKLAQSSQHDIGMDILLDFSSVTFLDDQTICTLFGNLLDNALEACLQVDEDRPRRIQVRSCVVAGQLQITVSNSYQGNIQFVNGLPKSTKHNLSEHGIGLKNVQRAIKKYNGILAIDTSTPDRFICTILIPFPEEAI